MRTLIATWLVTLGVIVALVVWLELSYTPEDDDTAPAAMASADTTDDGRDASEDMPADPDLTVVDDPSEGLAEDPSEGPAEEAEPATAEIAGDPPEEIAPAEAPVTTVPRDQLFEDGPYGALPVSVDGTQPWRAFGVPSDVAENTPRIAIILSGLGQNARITQKALLQTPPEITLAFSPYGQNLGQFAEDAARLGHEMLIMVPMEPNDYPVNDPGPHSLLTSLSDEENIDRLHFLLARFKGYVGLINDMGSKFTSNRTALRPVMADLQRRGLLFVDARSSSASIAIASAQDFGVPWAENSLFIDHRASGKDIDKELAELERLAKRNGLAVGVGHPYPITVERILSWAPTLADKGIALVPITATAFKRTVR